LAGLGPRLVHHPVIGLDALPAADSGHEGFVTSRIAGFPMQFQVACGNNQIRLGHRTEKLDGGAPGALANLDAIPGVMVQAAKAPEHFFSHQLPVFQGAVGAVDAQPEDDGHLVIFNPGPI
jgi:hypothetical protein